jgi:hypothetical protein
VSLHGVAWYKVQNVHKKMTAYFELPRVPSIAISGWDGFPEGPPGFRRREGLGIGQQCCAGGV